MVSTGNSSSSSEYKFPCSLAEAIAPELTLESPVCGISSEEDEGLPDEGRGVTSEMEEDVDAVERLRTRPAWGDCRSRREDPPADLQEVAEYMVRATEVSIAGGSITKRANRR